MRSVPGQENTLHHRKVLHENIPVWFRAEVSYSVTDAELDGSFQDQRCRLTKHYREEENIFVQKKKLTSSSFDNSLTFHQMLSVK